MKEVSEPQLPEWLITQIRSQFGGMGTLNDLAISRINGHVVDDESEANRRLNELRRALWNAIHRTDCD